MTRTVKGYHGTTYSVALAIVQRSAPFDLSVGEGDWLGRGAYFFEENLGKAIERAFSQVNVRARLGILDSAAVVAADLDLDDCLDLCSSLWHEHLSRIAADLKNAGELRQQHGPPLTTAGDIGLAPTTFVVADYPMPIHTASDHFADKKVIDALVADLLLNDEAVTSVRFSFACGEQPYSNSYFFSDTHTQIAVLDPSVVVRNPTIIHPVPTPASLRTNRKAP